MRWTISVFVFLLFSTALHAELRSRLLKARVEIGELIPVVLVAEHSPGELYLFPDSSAEFGALHYHHHKAFPTEWVNDSMVRDSAVYYLQALSMDSAFQFQLQVKVRKADGSQARLMSDTLLVSRTDIIQQMPTKPELKARVGLYPLEKEFNYPYFLAGLGGVLVLLAGLALAFGNYVKAIYYRLKLRWAHRRFQQRVERLSGSLKQQPKLEVMEELVNYWKSYSQHLTGQPYQAMSSKELAQHFKDGKVSRALKEADRWMYGHLKPSDPAFVGQVLAEKAEELYQQKSKEPLEHA